MSNKILVRMRWWTAADTPQLVALEELNHAWDAHSEADFNNIMKYPDVVCMVAEDYYGGAIVGFVLYQLQRKSIKIFSLEVTPSLQRKNIGSQLINKLKDKLTTKKRTRLFIEVPETSLGAQLFLRSQAFIAVKVIREAYVDPVEDAFLFVFSTPEAVGGIDVVDLRDFEGSVK